MARGVEDTVGAFVHVFDVQATGGGILSGKTFGAKDLFDVAGHVTGGGNPAWAASHGPAAVHAHAVGRLLDAGAALVGKTHTDELAYSLMGVNAHYGTPVNSADPRRIPGGSSSGSAAAVAAGLVDIGLGTDTGGSVRLPASFCGIWGLRTSFGAIPLEGVLPFTRSFDTVGWFARDADTMARAAEALGCPTGPMPTRTLLPVDVWARAGADCVAALGPALSRLEALTGPAVPVLIAPEGLEYWREVFRICQAAEIWSCLGGWIEAHTPDFGPGIRERLEAASRLDADTVGRAEQDWQAIQTRMSEIVGPESVLVFPTSPAPAPFLDADDATLDGFRQDALAMLCAAGLSGAPQLSVPAGVVDGGPVGLSLLGAQGRDLALIRLAEAAGIGETA